METSSVCNAECPMCPRAKPSFKKNVPNMSLSLEKVKTLFGDDMIRNLDYMFMCGNYGDPAAANDTIEIFQHFKKINVNIELRMNSNGGLRTKEWWFRLGEVLTGPQRSCVFSIDGLADTNHIYRVNTNFEKIIENACNFIKAGGNAHWDFLVFEHNEHQVDSARKMAYALGFTHFQEKVSCRFDAWPNVKHIRPPKGEKYK